MARNRSLSQLREDLRWQADQLGATLRHDNASLNRVINQSIQRFREWVSEQGWPIYLKPISGVLPVGPTAPYAFAELDLDSFESISILRVFFMECTVNGQILDVPQIPFEQRNQYQGIFGPTPTGSTQSIPVGFIHYGTKIGILPPPQSAYPFTLWYLPLLADLTNDTDMFDGVAGWEEWVIWDGLVKIIVRDHDPQAYGYAAGERDRLQADFLQRLRQDRPSVARRYDLRGMRNRRTML